MIESLVLYVEAFWLSPWTCSAFVSLREKQLPFHTSIAVTRPGVGAVETLLERALTGTAPVLQHGSFWLAESLAIIEYLEDTFAPPEHPPLLPRDPHERARARQLMSWLRTSHEALRRERPLERVLYPRSAATTPHPPPAPLSPAARKAADDLLRVASRLGADARGRLFADFSVCDVELSFALVRLRDERSDGLPEPLLRYLDTVWSRPSVREFVDHARPPHAPPT
jgi:glutathione S-transferase